ncbi:hypothetical protein BXZ70DRAFT_1010504 [Cristinia sonorae]|uniref:GAR domain-containing protein n=1 Tax=Cristinia sonorae TaxID=1940300 RepID=A0A8K0UKT8_9AGAR|nr:hypothetical protein BXZ70DRAFT_1010504 [Cristinia sonorae]
MSLSSSSQSSLHVSSSSLNLLQDALPSPARSISSGSSSSLSLNGADEENVTITAKGFQSAKFKGKQKSVDDIHLLATSTRMTELSYAISDIQTRIFEIQELRHNSQSQSSDAANAPKGLDQSLASLDERLETVSQGIKAVNETLEPLLDAVKTPTLVSNHDTSEHAAILRKHSDLIAEWDAVQKESQVLREELKEDKWLTVFRTVTEQADGMMASLEKAVNRCQEFIYQVQKYGVDDGTSQASSRGSTRSEKTPLSLDTFTNLSDQFEAKKKHYMPATAKVLSIIDKGVQDRVTKNGECLRRHAESTQRWRNLQDRITRTESDMERMRASLLAVEQSPSEIESSASGSMTMSRSQNGYLATPVNDSRSKTKGAISRSMSPFRKLARKIQKATKSPTVTPITLKKTASTKTPSTDPVPTLRHRASLFNLLSGSPQTPTTPDRPGHKYSQSLTPDSSPSPRKIYDAGAGTVKRPAWNSSTKVEGDERGQTLKTRRPSISGTAPPAPRRSEDNSSPYKRSLSRSSMASSRPWSPVTSSVSTAHSSNSPFPLFRPPSRAQTPSMSGALPRTRPKTPSHIPAPVKGSAHWRSMSSSPSDQDWEADITTSTFSERLSLDRSQTPSGHPPRPPSRSMIPLPSFQIQSASRPGSAMSHYRPESSMSFRGSGTPRPSVLKSGMPPSSFKDSSAPRTPVSRPSSRTGTSTAGYEGLPVHLYVPVSTKDPLDNEVAMVVNSIAHGLLIERVDPPLRTTPKEGEEIRAQYAFSNSLSRKLVTCKLTTLARSGGKHTTKKVMCRVGGGWQDLHLYIINRQAGI